MIADNMERIGPSLACNLFFVSKARKDAVVPAKTIFCIEEELTPFS